MIFNLNFKESTGVQAELKIAQELGKTIVYMNNVDKVGAYFTKDINPTMSQTNNESETT